MELNYICGDKEVELVIERNCLERLVELMDTNRRYFIVSDDGVPNSIIEKVQKQLPNTDLFVFRQGEASKNLQTYQDCIEEMLRLKYTRRDCVLAIGGGVVGDLAGFVAATYLRGVDFINIPTTTLSQIDSSIGGKVAVDMAEIKNCVGAFWQPIKVLIDPCVLDTLSLRHTYNGLIEALKAGLIADEALFRLFETENILDNLDEIIIRSLKVKKKVVEEDEKETGLRKILNFGHTIGHGIESATNFDMYYHGECVGLGMLAILENESIKERVEKILLTMNCPIKANVDANKVFEYVQNDKKSKGAVITIVQVSEIGKADLIDKKCDELHRYCEGIV